MICYNVTFQMLYGKKDSLNSMANAQKDAFVLKYEDIIKEINSFITVLPVNGEFYCVAHRITDAEIEIAIACWPDKIGLEKICCRFQKLFSSEQKFKIGDVLNKEEISIKHFLYFINDADKRDYLDYGVRKTEYDLNLGYFDSNYFNIIEDVIDDSILSKQDSLDKAISFMADKSLLSEIDRIYSDDNEKIFYGHPVHYKIQAGDCDTAMVIIKLLVQMLYSQNRIQGTRVNFLTNFNDRALAITEIEDVIVIFAGYPDKMKGFIDKNEGLKNRIAFHLNFPDYNPDELLQIMHLMLKERGYRAEKAADKKCLDIFRQACQIEDYGNGRFVINMIERAILNQSNRLMLKRSSNISKNRLITLTADDFDDSVLEGIIEKPEPAIGFVV